MSILGRLFGWLLGGPGGAMGPTEASKRSKFTYDPFEDVSHINETFVPVVCDALS